MATNILMAKNGKPMSEETLLLMQLGVGKSVLLERPKDLARVDGYIVAATRRLENEGQAAPQFYRRAGSRMVWRVK